MRVAGRYPTWLCQKRPIKSIKRQAYSLFISLPLFPLSLRCGQSSTGYVHFLGCLLTFELSFSILSPTRRPTNKLSDSYVRKNIKTGLLINDEFKFEIFGSRRRVYVRRRTREQMITACVVPTVKPARGNVMIWSYFAGNRVSDI